MTYAKETRVLFDDAGRPERVVFVRGCVSKTHNPHEVWLRRTRADRIAKQYARRKRRLKHYKEYERARQAKPVEMAKRVAWETENAHRRKGERRKLFNKLRRAGVGMQEARAQSGWGIHG